jgi:hypothetical protein
VLVKRFRPILSVLLALLVLVSGTSFMVGVHHCNGHVASVALFSKADPCPMETQLPPCHKAVKNTCCSDERIVHESDDLKPTVAHIHVASAPLIAELVSPVVIATLVPVAPTIQLRPADFSPPLALPDLNIGLSKFQI